MVWFVFVKAIETGLMVSRGHENIMIMFNLRIFQLVYTVLFAFFLFLILIDLFIQKMNALLMNCRNNICSQKRSHYSNIKTPGRNHMSRSQICKAVSQTFQPLSWSVSKFQRFRVVLHSLLFFCFFFFSFFWYVIGIFLSFNYIISKLLQSLLAPKAKVNLYNES